MICKTCPLGALSGLKYVVILSRCGGRILLNRHRQRAAWEMQGGHIEPGATTVQAAHCELAEESGAQRYALSLLCDYWAGSAQTGAGAAGRVFAAEIETLGPLPQSVMAETCLFDALPDSLTYPAITPVLIGYLQAQGCADGDECA